MGKTEESRSHKKRQSLSLSAKKKLVEIGTDGEILERNMGYIDKENMEPTQLNFQSPKTPSRKRTKAETSEKKPKRKTKERKVEETPKVKDTDRKDLCPVSCFKTLGEYLQGLRGKELRILVAKLVSQDMSLLRKIQDHKKFIEEFATSTILEELLHVDRESMKKTLTQSLQDDESWFYKEEDVARSERAANYATVLRSYCKKASTFCNNNDVNNAITVLEVITEDGFIDWFQFLNFAGMPVFDDINDKNGELQEVFEELVSVWQFVLSSQKLPDAKLHELAELFGVTHTLAAEHGYTMFEKLQQQAEEKLLDSTLQDYLNE